MKITAFNGSPRGTKSNTGFMVNDLLEGASKEGAETEQVYLSEKSIGHCLGCFKCWIGTPGACVIRDNMSELLEKVMQSDIIIMATPLYVDGVSGILKNFMDRLIPLADPHFERMARNLHSKVVGEVYLDCGEMLQSSLLVLKPVITQYRKSLTKAGSELVKQQTISPKTAEKLAKPLLPGRIFIREANKYWDRELAKLNN